MPSGTETLGRHRRAASFRAGRHRRGRVREILQAGLIDSFGFVQLVAFLEKEFGIKITDDEVLSDSLSSFAKIRSFTETKVRDGAAA